MPQPRDGRRFGGPGVDAPFMASTASYAHHLKTQEERRRREEEEDRMPVATDKILMARLRGGGVRSNYGIDRNSSTDAKAAIEWNLVEKHAVRGKDRARKFPGSEATPIPPALRSYANLHREVALYHQAQHDHFSADTLTPEEEKDLAQRIFHDDQASRPSTATPSLSRPSTSPSTAPPTPCSIGVLVGECAPRPRDSSGYPEKIGHFRPSPIIHTDTTFYRSTSWSRDVAFALEIKRRMKDKTPKQIEMEQREEEKRRSFREPAMDDPLYSSFCPGGVWQDWVPPKPLPPYRSRLSVAKPLPDGRYEPKDQLFLQRLVDKYKQCKPDISLHSTKRKVSKNGMDVSADPDDPSNSAMYETILEAEWKKRMRKEAADKKEAMSQRMLNRTTSYINGASTLPSLPDRPASAAPRVRTAQRPFFQNQLTADAYDEQRATQLTRQRSLNSTSDVTSDAYMHNQTQALDSQYAPADLTALATSPHPHPTRPSTAFLPSPTSRPPTASATTATTTAAATSSAASAFASSTSSSLPSRPSTAVLRTTMTNAQETKAWADITQKLDRTHQRLVLQAEG